MAKKNAAVTKPKNAATKKPKTNKGNPRGKKSNFVVSSQNFRLLGKTIMIAGRFTNAANNNVLLDVYRPNPDVYNLSRTFSNDFNQPADQLVSGDGYYIDVTVTNTGTFNLIITGDFNNSPIRAKVTNNFQRLGYVVIIN